MIHGTWHKLTFRKKKHLMLEALTLNGISNHRSSEGGTSITVAADWKVIFSGWFMVCTWSRYLQRRDLSRCTKVKSSAFFTEQGPQWLKPWRSSPPACITSVGVTLLAAWHLRTKTAQFPQIARLSWLSCDHVRHHIENCCYKKSLTATSGMTSYSLPFKVAPQDWTELSTAPGFQLRF